MSRWRHVFRSSLIVILVSCFCLSVFGQQAGAADVNDFKAGDIISDAVFYDANAMSTSQVQLFLNSKVPACDTNGEKLYTGSRPARDYNDDGRIQRWERGQYAGNPKPFVCLKNYRQDTPSESAVSGLCGNIPARTARTAAQIITDVSNACGVSPKVLIVLLQKEQGLVTDDWPWQFQYTKATGFACPDTSPCNPAYAGFFYQVYSAAYQFKKYRLNPTNYNYIAGQNNRIFWHPSGGNYLNESGNKVRDRNDVDNDGNTTEYRAGCGYNWVSIRNQATAGLYNYTPYAPNQAALNAGYGTGNSCSAYGNRNFFLYFSDWFGSTHSIKYEALDTPRWLQLKADVHKTDLDTSLPIDGTLRAGKQIYFSTKVTIDGVMYLRTKNDTQYKIDKGIPYSQLEEIPINFVPLESPRWLEADRDLRKIHPRTNQTMWPDIKDSQQIFFDSKVQVGGEWYLRTHHDTVNNTQAVIPLSFLNETVVEYETFHEPRWMVINKDTYIYDVKSTKNTGSIIQQGTERFFDYKITINGVTYAHNGLPAAGSYVGVPLIDLDTVRLDFRNLRFPRTMQMNKDARKYDPVADKSVDSVLPEGRTIKFIDKVEFQGKIYLRTEHDKALGLRKGILLNDLSEYFISLQDPRWMITVRDLYKQDATTNTSRGQIIPAGTKLYFETKANVGPVIYLRTQDDTNQNINVGIEIKSLKEDFVPLQIPRSMKAKGTIYRQNPTTGMSIGSPIPNGTQFNFDTKTEVNGHVYLRSEEDTAKGANVGILWSDLIDPWR